MEKKKGQKNVDAVCMFPKAKWKESLASKMLQRWKQDLPVLKKNSVAHGIKYGLLFLDECPTASAGPVPAHTKGSV